jgi:hypothetical protein
MGATYPSESELRAYVEHELDRTLRADRPDLTVVFQGEAQPLVPVSQPLWWSISSPKMDPSELLLGRHYLLEARLSERQFVIWFGGLCGFSGTTPRDVMLPAVHIPFPWAHDQWLLRSPFAWAKEVVRVFASKPSSSAVKPPDAYSLGEVLRFMLRHEATSSAVFDPVVFPMSGCRY